MSSQSLFIVLVLIVKRHTLNSDSKVGHLNGLLLELIDVSFLASFENPDEDNGYKNDSDIYKDNNDSKIFSVHLSSSWCVHFNQNALSHCNNSWLWNLCVLCSIIIIEVLGRGSISLFNLVLALARVFPAIPWNR